MTELSAHLEPLAQAAHPDGGWGYAPGQAPQLEPTCLGLLALALEPERYGPQIQKASEQLERAARPDGSYRPLNARHEAVWPTSLVLFARTALGQANPSAAASAGYLLRLRGCVPDNPEAGEMHDIDMSLAGWPWAENNFSWVEPTCWAVLALRALGHGQHPRVQEGTRMLLDRAMDAGGINYGNRQILGKMTDPIPTTTALLLVALQGEKHARLDAAVQYLLAQQTSEDVEHLAWSALALDLYPQAPGAAEALRKIREAIVAAEAKRRATPWLRPNCMRQALAALALGTATRNWFRLPAEAPAVVNPHPAGEASAPGLSTRLSRWFRGMLVKGAGQIRPLPVMSAVHIARAAAYDDRLVEVLAQQYEHFRATVPLQNKRVVLKPNLVEYHRDKVINTDPRLVGAVIDLCKREGAREILVAEGPGHWRNVEFLVAESGLGDVLKAKEVPFVDLNHDEPVKTPNLGQLTRLEYLYLTRTITSADVVISLPKLKTHHWAGATLSLKNLFGTLPGICYGWPKNELHWRGIDNSIVDIALTRTPDLAIVDGIVGMEGDGPLNGTAKFMGITVMGHDLLATDATCCRLMQLDPEKIGYLVLGHMKKLGRMREAEIPQLGEKIEALAQPFATVPHLEGLRTRRSA